MCALDQSQSNKMQTSVLLQSAPTVITASSGLFAFKTRFTFEIRIFLSYLELWELLKFRNRADEFHSSKITRDAKKRYNVDLCLFCQKV